MSILLKRPATRRAALRGLLGGGAVSLALPFLDCFLDGNGEALAAGGPIPVRFGTWYWGMGHTPGHAVKDRADVGEIQFLEECKALIPLRQHINYFNGFSAPLDGRSNSPHRTGWVASRTGVVPPIGDEILAPTLDVLVADAISAGTRFRNLDVTSTGNPIDIYTARSNFSRGTAEVSPVGFYARLFGGDFVDPNRGEFKPDPRVMVEKSVLSGLVEESKSLAGKLGASDRARLDEYFTSIRQLENQLALQLEKPPANEMCKVPASPRDVDGERAPTGVEIEAVHETHRLMTELLVMAVACNQTKVFNMAYSDNFSKLRHAGETYTHHTLTHEEPTDVKLGYQPTAFWFNCKTMEGCADFINAFAKTREGAGSLLDNVLIFAASETSYARIHAVDNLPMMTFGRAGGRVKTGLHVPGRGDPITRVGFTCLRAMGLPLDSWGAKSLRVTKPISEILV